MSVKKLSARGVTRYNEGVFVTFCIVPYLRSTVETECKTCSRCQFIRVFGVAEYEYVKMIIQESVFWAAAAPGGRKTAPY